MYFNHILFLSYIGPYLLSNKRSEPHKPEYNGRFALSVNDFDQEDAISDPSSRTIEQSDR